MKSPFNLLREGNVIAVSVALFVLVGGTYLPSVRNGFVNLDDPDFVYANAHVLKGVSWEGIRWAFTSLDMGFWHPLTWLSLMLDSQISGLKAGYFHLTGLLFHAANTVLLFLVFQRMTDATWRSAFVAALFGMHPLHVESVAWVAERKDVLSAFFGMLALLAYAKYAESRVSSLKSKVEGEESTVHGPQPTVGRKEPGGATSNLQRRTSNAELLSPDGSEFEVGGSTFGVRRSKSAASGPWIWYCAALAFFALSLMSKTMLVTLPLMLLLLDYWPLGRVTAQESTVHSPQEEPEQSKVQSLKSEVEGTDSGVSDECTHHTLIVPKPDGSGSRITHHAPPFTLHHSIAPLLRLVWEKVPFFALAFAGSVVTLFAQAKMGALKTATGFPLPARIANAILSYTHYLVQTVWPARLAAYYPYPRGFSLVAVGIGAALGLVVSVAVWRGARRSPYLAFGWLWYIVTLLPVIGLVQIGSQAQADRYTYIPLIGIFTMLAWGTYDLTRHWRRQPLILCLAGGAVVLLCIGATWRQIGYWQDGETLFRHALAVTRNNDLAQNNLGAALSSKGRLDEAIPHLQAAIQLRPDYAVAHNNLGAALSTKGRFEEAIVQLQTALKFNPNYASAHANLGMALSSKGQLDEAMVHLQKAVALRPDYAMAHANLGLVLFRKGQVDEAIVHLQQAVKLSPDYAPAYRDLGTALGAKGRLDEAIVSLRKAVKLAPGDPEARYNLGLALGAKGRTDDAILQYRLVLKLDPRHVDAHNNLGAMLGAKGRLDEAIAEFQEALRLRPADSQAQNNLRAARAMKAAATESPATFNKP